MIGILMISRDTGIPGESTEEFAAVFTDPAALNGYVLNTPLPEGETYVLVECEPNKPGVARKMALAVREIPQVESPALAGSPIEVVAPAGLDLSSVKMPPFSIEIFGAARKQSILRLFENPATGILEAQFRPGDLSEAAEQFVRELQKISMRTLGTLSGE